MLILSVRVVSCLCGNLLTDVREVYAGKRGALHGSLLPYSTLFSGPRVRAHRANRYHSITREESTDGRGQEPSTLKFRV